MFFGVKVHDYTDGIPGLGAFHLHLHSHDARAHGSESVCSKAHSCLCITGAIIVL